MAESDSYVWKSLFPESPRQRPCHRSKQAACRVQGQVYMYGGRIDGHKTLRDFWRYDISTNIWTRMECGGDTPPPLQEHTMIAHQGCLYIFGGELGYGSCGETPLWIYNIARQTWEKPVIDSEVMTPTGRRGHTVVAWQGGMHLYGGYVDLKGSSNELWTLDFETKWWHLSVGAQLDNSPAPRHWHSAAVYQSNMWVYGGLNNLLPLRDLWRWNFDSRQWTRVKGRQSPSFLHGHSAVCVVDSMMIFGGEDSEGEYGNDLWKFHFGSCTWQCTTPTRRVIPTSCTRHVMLSIPSNQIMDDTYLCPTAGDLRPQSAPTQVHRDRNVETGGALTRPGHLADMFVLRPRSSPPVVGNERRQEDRRAHHFTNRVHPSPDEEPDPRRTLFGSNDEDLDGEDETLYTAAEDDGIGVSNSQGDGGKTLDGMWAVPVATKDATTSPLREQGRPNGTWAMTATVVPENDSQVEEEETSGLLVNEASPVHHRYGDARWNRQEEIGTHTSSSHLLHSNGDCILEDVVSDPSFPPPSIQVNGDITPSAAQNLDRSITTPTYGLEADKECNNLEEADNLIYHIPKSTSIPDSTTLASMNNHTDTLDGTYRTFTSNDNNQGSAIQTSELPVLQEPEESNVDERTSPTLLGRGNVICVKPLDREISDTNVDIIKHETDRQKLLPSTNKQMATFVNYGFMSSRESLLHDETSQDVDFKIHQSDPPKIILNGSTDQSSGRFSPVNQSCVTSYTQNTQGHHSGIDANNTNDHQSDVTFHQSSRQMLYKRKLQAAKSQQQSRVIHIKPTHHRVCQISVEEMNKPNPNSQANTATDHSEQEQKPVATSEDKNRPRLHGRSQTLNSLPDRRQASPGRPRRILTDQALRQEEDQEQNDGIGEEDDDEWEWPVFLYLMGGEETGSSSLHRNNSPMSVWKCCIVQGKQSENEIQRILAQY